jgi:Fe2+ transport system protein B
VGAFPPLISIDFLIRILTGNRVAMQIPSLSRITEQLQVSLIKAKDALNQNAQQLKDLGLEQAGETIQIVNKFAENALSKVTERNNQVSDDAKSIFEQYFEAYSKQVDNLNQTISQGIKASINSSSGQWIDNHPQLVWSVTHPLQALGIFLFILFLLSGLVGATSRLTEKFWIYIVTYPFKLIAFISGFILTIFNKNRLTRANLAETGSTGNETKIAAVLSRMEMNRQEQTLLLQELKILLNPK